MFRATIPVGLAALALASPLAAQQAPADSARVHVVRRGDTLWDLAGRYFGDPYLWPEIFRHNRAVVVDPDRIFPLERILIPGLAGVGPEAEAEEGELEEAEGADRTVFFTAEEGPAGSSVTDADEVAERRVVEPGVYFRAGLLVPEAEMRPVGELVEVLSPSVVPMRLRPQVAPHDRVYLRMAAGAGLRPGSRVHFFRPGRELPPHGRVWLSTGVARVESIDGAVAILEVEQLFDQMRIGDVAVTPGTFPVRAGSEPQPAAGAQGRILAFESPHPLQALQELAFVDLGGRSGVKEGDELEVFLPRTREVWGERPEVVVARLQVVRAAERTATVRVVHLEHPALAAGLPVRVVGKMP